MLKRFLATSAIALLVVVSCALSSAQATPITVLNPSFESPANAVFTALVDDWDTNASGTEGTVNEALGGYGDATDGVQMGFLNASSTTFFEQTLAETIQAGTYTLTLDVAQHIDLTSAPTVFAELFAGTTATIVASNSDSDLPNNPDAASWDTLTVIYNVSGGDTNIGSALGIYIRHGGPTDGHQVLVDNVELDFVAVPEPSGIVLSMLGIAGLLIRRRRK